MALKCLISERDGQQQSGAYSRVGSSNDLYMLILDLVFTFSMVFRRIIWKTVIVFTDRLSMWLCHFKFLSKIRPRSVHVSSIIRLRSKLFIHNAPNRHDAAYFGIEIEVFDIAPVLNSGFVFLKIAKISFTSDVESSKVICKHVGSGNENIRG